MVDGGGGVGGVGGWIETQSADVCPLPRCSGPAAGPHLQLQQAPLPHLLPLRGGPRKRPRTPGRRRSWRCGKRSECVGEYICLAFETAGGGFGDGSSLFLPRVLVRPDVSGSLRCLLKEAVPCCAAAKGQRVKRPISKSFLQPWS